MKKITIKVYNYDELDEKAKQKALNWFYQTWNFEDWSEFILDDAKKIGLEIEEFDTFHNTIKGNLTHQVDEIIDLILNSHEENCETYQLAHKWKQKLDDFMSQVLDDDYPNELEIFNPMAEEDFKKELIEEYLSILKKEYEFQTSRKQIEKTIRASEYTFLENGNPY